MDVLEHMETDDICFETMRDILHSLAPGGVLICRVPNAAHMLGTYSRYMDITHRRGFTSHSIRQALMAAGYDSVEFVPTQSSILLGKIRLGLEHLLHRVLFLLGGYTQEHIFTQNVIAAARKSCAS
jgi:predicted SAM-dependent methyltransferase